MSHEGSHVSSSAKNKLYWGVDKKNLKDCNVTVKDGVVSVVNGYIPVASAEYTAKNNGDGTYTVTAVSTSKNYTGSITVTAKKDWPDSPLYFFISYSFEYFILTFQFHFFICKQTFCFQYSLNSLRWIHCMIWQKQPFQFLWLYDLIDLHGS